MITQKQIRQIALNVEDDIFDEVFKKKYDKYQTLEELQNALNTYSIYDNLVWHIVRNAGVDIDVAEDYVIENNLVSEVLKCDNIVSLLKSRLPSKSMSGYKTTPKRKNNIEKLENSVRRMF